LAPLCDDVALAQDPLDLVVVDRPAGDLAAMLREAGLDRRLQLDDPVPERLRDLLRHDARAEQVELAADERLGAVGARRLDVTEEVGVGQRVGERELGRDATLLVLLGRRDVRVPPRQRCCLVEGTEPLDGPLDDGFRFAHGVSERTRRAVLSIYDRSPWAPMRTVPPPQSSAPSPSASSRSATAARRRTTPTGTGCTSGSPRQARSSPATAWCGTSPTRCALPSTRSSRTPGSSSSTGAPASPAATRPTTRWRACSRRRCQASASCSGCSATSRSARPRCSHARPPAPTAERSSSRSPDRPKPLRSRGRS